MAILFITGLRASGKTSVGKIVADKLGYAHKDQDGIFYKRFGTISEFVCANCWSGFYDEFFRILQEIAKDNTVVSTGGSVFMGGPNDGFDQKKVDYCRSRGFIVMLSPSRSLSKGAEICFRRSHSRDTTIFGDSLPEQEFEDFLRDYVPKHRWYQKKADRMVYDNDSPEAAAEKVLRLLPKEFFNLSDRSP